MLDASFLPRVGNANIDWFTSTDTWFPWVKPRNCSFVYIYCVGAGGGGGGGFTAAASAQRGGGGGGGSGAISRLFINAMFLPDTIYAYVGRGGAGGSGSGVAGTAGGRSYLGVYGNPAGSPHLILRSGGADAGGGGAGTGAAGGAAGAASTITASSDAFLSGLGSWVAVAGQAGAAGGASGVGTSVTWGGAGIFGSGGAGGGGVTSSDVPSRGGQITGAGYLPTLGPTTFIPSQSGILIPPSLQLITTGGTGGFGASAGVGGVGIAGGDGGIGSGGGGGGGGVTGGAGGRGGDGLVVIMAW